MADVVSKADVDVADAELRFTRWRREKSNRVWSRQVGSASGTARGGHGWRRTVRDEQLLEFATLHGMVLLRQAATWFYGGNASTALKRVVKMEQAGLVNRDAGVPAWAGTVITPTRAGQKVGVQGLPPMFERLALRDLSVPENLLHPALVADRLLVAMSQGVRVLTERQIRLMDREPDQDAVQEFLESVGVRFSVGETDPGVRPGRVFRRVYGADGQVTHTVPEVTYLSCAIASERQSATTETPTSVRFPDFVKVLASGELAAVEVEIATKASDRLQAIVVGYSKAVARLIPDGRGGVVRESVVERGEDGQERTVQRVALRRGQFRQVEWVCTPEAKGLLWGRFNPRKGEWARGFVPASMPFEYKSVQWASPPPNLPITVNDVVAHDSGVQYAVDQRSLPARYRCSYKRWLLWQEVWRREVPAADRPRKTFVKWVTLPAGGPGEVPPLELCLLTEAEVANAVRPRPRAGDTGVVAADDGGDANPGADAV